MDSKSFKCFFLSLCWRPFIFPFFPFDISPSTHGLWSLSSHTPPLLCPFSHSATPTQLIVRTNLSSSLDNQCWSQAVKHPHVQLVRVCGYGSGWKPEAKNWPIVCPLYPDSSICITPPALIQKIVFPSTMMQTYAKNMTKLKYVAIKPIFLVRGSKTLRKQCCSCCW